MLVAIAEQIAAVIHVGNIEQAFPGRQVLHQAGQVQSYAGSWHEVAVAAWSLRYDNQIVVVEQ